MSTVQLLFVFSAILNLTLARPNTSPPNVPAIEAATNSNDESGVETPTDGVVYGLILNFASPNDIHSLIDPDVEDESESATLKEDTSSTNGEELVRNKRFLNNIFGSAFQSFGGGNWRECGRTSWGTTIYSNGVGTACFGTCPERVRCGYGYERGGFDTFDDTFGYRGEYRTGTFFSLG